ncbi:MAG: NRDE family protein [Bacteroidia bacterium]|nr:NRDE family protein [Bacteroidia bacterium]
MCLIIFAWKLHPRYPLILAANRDEYLARQTAPLGWWEENGVLAGRDLEAGGTWMGISKAGNFSALTNFRDPANIKSEAPSRGHLVSHFLERGGDPGEYLKLLAEKGDLYNGFNLLTGNADHLWYYSNYGDEPQELSPGLYGLSNHLLDTPWPKVRKGKDNLSQLLAQPAIQTQSLIESLADGSLAPDEELPHTGVPLEWERQLSAMFIKMPKYGTRVTSALLVDQGGKVTFREKGYVPESDQEFAFEIE